MPAHIAFRFLFAALLLYATGCSISDSVSASSKSSSASFKSSSDSSASSSGSSASSAGRSEAYRNDVRDYTAAYVQSGGQFDTFTRGLSNIASKHGVSNWESDDETYFAIGQGLRKAGVTTSQLSVWKTNLAGTDSTKAAAMQKGYDSQK